MSIANMTQRGSVQLAPAFLLAFGVGTIFIVGSEIFGKSTFARFLGTFGPLAAMLIYLTVAWQGLEQHKTNTREQVADSVYFRGFMFTLLALTSALYAVSEIDTATIVSRFSLALSTTLVGLLVKVLMTQFSTDLENRKRRLDDGLTESMTSFQKQLNKSAVMLDQHVAAVNVRIEKLAEASFEELEELAEKHRETAQTKNAAFAESMETRLTQLADHADSQRARIDVQLDTTQDQIEKMLSQLGNRMDTAGQKIAAGGAEVGNQLDNQARIIEALASRFQSIEVLLNKEEQRHAMNEQREEDQQRLAESVIDLSKVVVSLVKSTDEKEASLKSHLTNTIDESTQNIVSSLKTTATGSVDLKPIEERLDYVNRMIKLIADEISVTQRRQGRWFNNQR